MYSEKLSRKLKKLGISIGDKIRIKTKEGEFDGILMPRAYESEVFVVKLSSGYNIGIDSARCEISLLEKYKEKKQKDDAGGKGEVSILGCGGTISSKVEYKTGAVHPMINPKELISAFPEINKITSIKTRNILSILSEDMAPDHWKIIARSVFEELKEGAKGIVVMHGTDTMHYTASALSFMIKNLPVPVVLVGAQRSSDRPSSENKMNLLNALYSSRKNVAEISICMHGTTNDDFCALHRGCRARKMHTSRRDAFRSINSPPLAEVDYSNERFDILVDDYNLRDEKRKPELDTKLNSNVAMVYLHPGFNPKILESFSDYDGIVIMGTGLGNAPTNPFEDKHARSILPNVKSLIDSGVAVVMAPQTIYGRLNLKVYSAGKVLWDIGVIGDGMDWIPETAFTKLCWVLGHTKNLKKVEELMTTNISGEISERSYLGSKKVV
ncbi:Glu-tRNA(Gln) amidotransferase subunit GatD [Candidatus Micrarchaeota archaeon]|nr:Glu-tRNA(Gln) amidotransferase subunit GatD [Candidatus Micrarchaeota archaeon]